jgi:hypothetical protein
MENVVFALYLIVSPINEDGTLGPDESYIVDSNMTKIECMREAFGRADAAAKVFGANAIAGMACEPDKAPQHWAK